MPYLARSQTNTSRILALHAVDSDGLLYNPDFVRYRVVRLSDNVQIEPLSGYTTIATPTHKGIYTPAWTVDVAATLGAHRIDWQYADTDGVTQLTWSQNFEITGVGTGLPFWTYCTPTDIRNEGIDSTLISDARLINLIRRAQETIDTLARQTFRPIRSIVKIDGLSSSILFFKTGIIGVEYVRVNNSTEDLDTDLYRVYSNTALSDDPARPPYDHRRNPKISLTGASRNPLYAGIYGSRTQGRFNASAQGQKVAGVFGFIEGDGTTPELIRYAMIRLIVAHAELIEIGSGSVASSVPSGPIIREKTDRHEIEYGFAEFTVRNNDFAALATSREVHEIIQEYKAPIGLGAPVSEWEG